MNKIHSNKQPNTTPGDDQQNDRKRWAWMGYILHNLDSDIRKITRLERLHLKILKRKQSAVFNWICLDNDLLPKYKIFVCVSVCNLHNLFSFKQPVKIVLAFSTAKADRKKMIFLMRFCYIIL